MPPVPNMKKAESAVLFAPPSSDHTSPAVVGVGDGVVLLVFVHEYIVPISSAADKKRMFFFILFAMILLWRKSILYPVL